MTSVKLSRELVRALVTGDDRVDRFSREVIEQLRHLNVAVQSAPSVAATDYTLPDRRTTYDNAVNVCWRCDDGGSDITVAGTIANTGSAGAMSMSQTGTNIYSLANGQSILGTGCLINSGLIGGCYMSVQSANTFGDSVHFGAWIVIRVAASGDAVVFTRVAGGATSMALGISSTYIPYCQLRVSTSGLVRVNGPQALLAGVPYHIAGGLNGGQLYLRINGVDVAQGTATGTVTYTGATPTFCLFNTTVGAAPIGNNFSGYIEEVTIESTFRYESQMMARIRRAMGLYPYGS